jgi:hypothetical protein
MKSSYPYRFALGQLGHLGQIAKTIANRAFRVSYPHIYAGTALGHGGTLHFQDVSGREKAAQVICRNAFQTRRKMSRIERQKPCTK